MMTHACWFLMIGGLSSFPAMVSLLQGATLRSLGCVRRPGSVHVAVEVGLMMVAVDMPLTNSENRNTPTIKFGDDD